MESRKSKKAILKNKKFIVIISIVILLIVIRLLLPRIILHYANKSLANLEGYYGRIDDIDLSLYRGAYQVDGIFIDKVDSVTADRTQFFSADKIDLSIEWKSLLDGRIVGELAFDSPILIFTKDKAEPEQVQHDTSDFRQVLKDLMPLKVNKFEVSNGSVHYKDESSNPPVDVRIDRMNVLATNLSNVRDTALLSASIRATGHVYKGSLSIDMKLDPLADDPTFDLNAEIKNTSLPEFNDFFQAYGKIDVNKGTFGLFTEIAAKDRKFVGYVKPVINNLDVVGPEDRDDNLLQKIWEGIAGALGQVLENPQKEQVATKIPIEGNFDDTTIGTWYAITTVLKNAFIQALYPALDYQISIASVEAEEPEEKKGFFQRIFSKDDKDKNDNKNEKEKNDNKK